MKDLIKQAVQRAANEQEAARTGGVSQHLMAGARADDAAAKELDDVLSSMTTRIKVIGCGGGGTNTVARCVEASMDNCEFVAINTDAQHLLMIKAPKKILMGKHITRGLGAGALPQIGEEAAEEAAEEIKKSLQGADLVFVTCGLGGGTGTGSAPVVAKIARELGALTIVIATLPFSVEGAVRMQNAEVGLARLRKTADTVIVVPNDKLLELAPRLPLNAAFKVADELLMRSIKGITELITKPGIVNLDFADLKTVMKGGGVAMIGLGEAEGEDRAAKAVREAISSPLLDLDVTRATGALINVIGGPDMTIGESEAVVQEIYQRIDPDARIIWGTSVDPSLDHSIRAMVVLTGVVSNQILGPTVRNRAQRRRDAAGVDFVL